jgi:hypothetical protein
MNFFTIKPIMVPKRCQTLREQSHGVKDFRIVSATGENSSEPQLSILVAADACRAVVLTKAGEEALIFEGQQSCFSALRPSEFSASPR